jgi:hypothetical protein
MACTQGEMMRQRSLPQLRWELPAMPGVQASTNDYLSSPPMHRYLMTR